MNLIPKTMVQYDMYNTKYRLMDNFYGPVSFGPLKQIRTSHAMLKVTSFIDFGSYIKSFISLEKNIYND